LASIITGAMILITVIALTPLFQNLPQAVLGAIVISSVISLLDVPELRRIYSLRKSDFWLAIVSMLGVLVIGVLSGLVIAVFLSLVIVLYRASRPNGAVIGKAPEGGTFGDIARHPSYHLVPDVLMYRLDASLFFANANLVRTQVRDLARQYAVHTVIIDLAATYGLDVASLDMLDEVLRDCTELDIKLLLVNVKAPVRDIQQKSGLMEKLGADRIFTNFDTALASLNDQQALAT
jgi:SulP family sulfate permease